MALAKKKKTPRQMPARYAGTCSACHGPIAVGEQMIYLGATGDCWHVYCYQAEADATTNPTGQDTPQQALTPEPEKLQRPAMATVKLDSKYGKHEYVRTDSLITWDGNTIFMSLLGAESYVQSVSGCFLDAKSRRYNHDLTVDHSVIRRHHEADYTKKSQKIGRALHQIVCDTRFTPEGPSIEKDFRYLLLAPDSDPAQDLYLFLRREIATPTLPDWSAAIYAAMTANGNNRHYSGPETPATAELIEPKIGEFHALRIRAGEERLDALISHLVSIDQITF